MGEYTITKLITIVSPTFPTLVLYIYMGEWEVGETLVWEVLGSLYQNTFPSCLALGRTGESRQKGHTNIYPNYTILLTIPIFVLFLCAILRLIKHKLNQLIANGKRRE